MNNDNNDKSYINTIYFNEYGSNDDYNNNTSNKK